MSGLARADSPWAAERGYVGDCTEWVSLNRVCARCAKPLPVQRHQGNPRRWCSETCRVAAWKAKRR